MTHSTTIREAAWNQRQNAFAHADAARAEAERLAGIAAHFTFCRDEANCFFTASGQAVQLAMTLNEVFTGKTRTVAVKLVDGAWFWYVENMAGCPFEAWELIACVQQRIGARLTAQLTGRAN